MTEHPNTNNTPNNETGPFSNDPALAAAWASQSQESTSDVLQGDPAEVAASVATAHAEDRRRLFRLNVQEIVPCIFVAVVFALAAFDAARPWAVLTASALGLGVGGYLVITSIRRVRADERFGDSVRDQIARRLEQVEHLANLYRNVAWWYLAPLSIAILLFRYGVAGEVRLGGADLAYYASCVVFAAVIYRMNRKLGRTRYEPEVDRLQAVLAEFDRVG